MGLMRQQGRVMRITPVNPATSSTATTSLDDMTESVNGIYMATMSTSAPSTVRKPNVSLLALKTGDSGKLRFRFSNEPEYVRVGSTILFREGRVKCVGKVSSVWKIYN